MKKITIFLAALLLVFAAGCREDASLDGLESQTKEEGTSAGENAESIAVKEALTYESALEYNWVAEYAPAAGKSYTILFNFLSDSSVATDSPVSENEKNLALFSVSALKEGGVIIKFDGPTMLNDEIVDSEFRERQLIVESTTETTINCVGASSGKPVVLTKATSEDVLKLGEKLVWLALSKKNAMQGVLRDSENKPLVFEPGLHFKMPLIESVKTLDARIQTMDNQADRFVTKEKKDLIVDSYIKWRISDFSRYYLATGGGDVSQAEVLLKRKFSDRLRSEIGRLDVKDIVTDSRGRLTLEVRDALNSGSAGTEDEVTTPAADDAIAKAAERVQAETNGKVPVINPNSMAALGIEVVDVRIKQINLPAEVSEAIYNRMRAEREAVARRHRSQGQEEAEKLRAAADYEVTKTLAESERQGRILRGEGDAEAAKLFADAFSQDPDFYAFIRSLRAYENSFQSNQNVMVLSPDSDFFRYMKTPANATR